MGKWGFLSKLAFWFAVGLVGVALCIIGRFNSLEQLSLTQLIILVYLLVSLLLIADLVGEGKNEQRRMGR